MARQWWEEENPKSDMYEVYSDKPEQEPMNENIYTDETPVGYSGELDEVGRVSSGNRTVRIMQPKGGVPKQPSDSELNAFDMWNKFKPQADEIYKKEYDEGVREFKSRYSAPDLALRGPKQVEAYRKEMETHAEKRADRALTTVKGFFDKQVEAQQAAKKASDKTSEGELIKQSLTDALGREPSAQELLQAMQERKKDIAREGRSTTMQSTFVDPKTGNPLIFNRVTNKYEVAGIEGDGGIAPKPVNPSAAEREKTATFEVLNDQLDRIEATYKPQYVGLISGQVGRVTQFKDADEAGFRQVILDVKDSLLRARSGAQINEQEYKRLAKLVPDFTDSEPQFKGKMKSFRTTINSIVGERTEAQRKGGVKLQNNTQQNNSNIITYYDNGKRYNIPSDKESAFLKSRPNAKRGK